MATVVKVNNPVLSPSQVKEYEEAMTAIIDNLSWETISVFAKAAKTAIGRSLIKQGQGFIKGKI